MRILGVLCGFYSIFLLAAYGLLASLICCWLSHIILVDRFSIFALFVMAKFHIPCWLESPSLWASPVSLCPFPQLHSQFFGG